MLQNVFIVLCVNFQCPVQGMIRRCTCFCQIHATGKIKDEFTKNDRNLANPWK